VSESYLIAGAGQAALQAAATLRSNGFRGEIVLYGDEPHLPYQRPPLSKKYLLGEIGLNRLELKPASFYAQNQISVRLDTPVESIDRESRTLRLSGGTQAHYDKLLIATGARVRRINLPGVNLQNIFYLRRVADVDAIRAQLRPGCHVALVGGGYIGLEVAAVAAQLGCQVNVLEMAARVMSRVVSTPVSDFYEAEHRKAGVTITLNAMVAGFEGHAGALQHILLTDGRRVPADVAIIGVGVDPNIEVAQAAGLTCDNGIRVDEFGATNDSHIFAAGDCTNHPNPFVGGQVRLESVQNAVDQARHAALAMLGKKTSYGEVPWFWSDQYDLKLQIAGIRAGFDEMVLRGDPHTRQFAVFYLRGGLTTGRVVAVEAVNAVSEYIIGRRLIAGRVCIPAIRLADLSQPMKSFVPHPQSDEVRGSP
jgi:3-phenylpropionate/trans-cinnamate dioxygenase ferredoxin reductase subunit